MDRTTAELIRLWLIWKLNEARCEHMPELLTTARFRPLGKRSTIVAEKKIFLCRRCGKVYEDIQ